MYCQFHEIIELVLFQIFFNFFFQSREHQSLKFNKEAPGEPISSAIVKYNYQAQQLDELSLSKGARILILEKSGDGWWRGQYGNKIGWFPSNYLQEVDNEDVVVNLEPTEIVEGQSLSNLEMLTSDGNIVPANNALDVITEDLDISDDSDDDHEPMLPNQETKQPDPPPPSEEANAPNNASSEADDDFMMF